MVQTLSDRYLDNLYDIVTQSASVIDSILQPYPELWKTEHSTLDIPSGTRCEIFTGMIGEQSSGKSTLLNSICCYPILPAASVITSGRPVEIRKSAKEYIQVVWNEEEQTRMIDFSRVRLEETFVRSLLEYGIKCCRNNIITCDNLNYLTTKPIRSSGAAFDLGMDDFDLFDPADHRQVMMLLMILLGSHVGTYGIRTESDLREEIKSMYRRLMARLGLDGETEFTVRLFWNSPLLCEGMVLMDLPGLRDTAGRSTVTMQQLHRLDSVVLLFSHKEEEPDLYRFAKDCLRDGKPTPAPGSLSRITAVLNKADLCGEETEKIISSIRTKCGFPETYPVYPICAISGEYLYTTVGGLDPKATFLCKANPQWTRTEGERALREQFEKPYQSRILPQIQRILTADLTERIHTLTGLIWLQDMMGELSDVKRRITLQRSFLICLENCGSQFTKSFYEALSSACSQALDAFHAEFHSSARRLLDNLLPSEGFEEAAAAFRGSLTLMEADILNRVELSFRRMKRKNFRIHLNHEENQAVFLEVHSWLAGSPDSRGERLVISDYLQPGSRQLELALDRQYQIYREGIGELVRNYQEFPCIFDRAFRTACDHAVDTLLADNPSLSQEDLSNYREQSRILQETVSMYLTETVHTRIRMLESDRTVAEEFSRTADLIRGYEQLLEAFYYKKCPEMLAQCRRAALLKDAVYFSPRQARAQFRNSFYASGARNDFLKSLDTLLTDAPEPENTDSSGSLKHWFSRLRHKIRCRNTHPQRVKLAVDNLSRQFCAYTGKDLRRFSAQMKKKAKLLMNTGKHVYAAENKQLSGVSSRFLSELSEMKTKLRPILQTLLQNETLQKDAAVLLKNLNEL